MSRLALLLVVGGIAACGAAQGPAAERPLGASMVELGMRFTRVGQEVLAQRWELAGYDLGEIDEIFERDLSHHSWHGDAKLRELSRQFAKQDLSAMRDAVQHKDTQAFRKTAEDAVKACNACHVVAHDAFIEVPATVGAPSPVVAPAS